MRSSTVKHVAIDVFHPPSSSSLSSSLAARRAPCNSSPRPQCPDMSPLPVSLLQVGLSTLSITTRHHARRRRRRLRTPIFFPTRLHPTLPVTNPFVRSSSTSSRPVSKSSSTHPFVFSNLTKARAQAVTFHHPQWQV
jgi:hypothetical protein